MQKAESWRFEAAELSNGGETTSARCHDIGLEITVTEPLLASWKEPLPESVLVRTVPLDVLVIGVFTCCGLQELITIGKTCTLWRALAGCAAVWKPLLEQFLRATLLSTSDIADFTAILQRGEDIATNQQFKGQRLLHLLSTMPAEPILQPRPRPHPYLTFTKCSARAPRAHCNARNRDRAPA